MLEQRVSGTSETCEWHERELHSSEAEIGQLEREHRGGKALAAPLRAVGGLGLAGSVVDRAGGPQSA